MIEHAGDARCRINDSVIPPPVFQTKCVILVKVVAPVMLQVNLNSVADHLLLSILFELEKNLKFYGKAQINFLGKVMNKAI